MFSMKTPAKDNRSSTASKTSAGPAAAKPQKPQTKQQQPPPPSRFWNSNNNNSNVSSKKQTNNNNKGRNGSNKPPTVQVSSPNEQSIMTKDLYIENDDDHDDVENQRPPVARPGHGATNNNNDKKKKSGVSSSSTTTASISSRWIPGWKNNNSKSSSNGSTAGSRAGSAGSAGAAARQQQQQPQSSSTYFNETYNATLSQIEQKVGVTSIEQHGFGRQQHPQDVTGENERSVYSPSNYFNIDLDFSDYPPEFGGRGGGGGIGGAASGDDDPSISTLGDESLLRMGPPGVSSLQSRSFSSVDQQQQIVASSNIFTLNRLAGSGPTSSSAAAQATTATNGLGPGSASAGRGAIIVQPPIYRTPFDEVYDSHDDDDHNHNDGIEMDDMASIISPRKKNNKKDSGRQQQQQKNKTDQKAFIDAANAASAYGGKFKIVGVQNISHDYGQQEDDISTLGDESLLRRSPSDVNNEQRQNQLTLQQPKLKQQQHVNKNNFVVPGTDEDDEDEFGFSKQLGSDQPLSPTSFIDADMEDYSVRSGLPPTPADASGLGPTPVIKMNRAAAPFASPSDVHEISFDINKSRMGSSYDGISPTSELGTPSVLTDPPSLRFHDKNRYGKTVSHHDGRDDDDAVNTSTSNGPSIVFPFDERSLATAPEIPVGGSNGEAVEKKNNNDSTLKKNKWKIIYFIVALAVFLLLVAGGAITYSVLIMNRSESDSESQASSSSSSNLDSSSSSGETEDVTFVLPTDAPTDFPTSIPTAFPSSAQRPSVPPTAANPPTIQPTVSSTAATSNVTDAAAAESNSTFFDLPLNGTATGNTTDVVGGSANVTEANPTEAIDDLLSIISTSSPGSLDAVATVESPQFMALNWLARDPSYWTYSVRTVLQRWVLAVFYYSTNGPAWNTDSFPSNFPGRTPWMSYSDECLWLSTDEGKNGNVCDATGRLTSIHLLRAGLEGTIPAEIGLLGDALEVLFLGGNSLGSTIPTTLGQLTALEKLQLRFNYFVGQIPTEFGNMRSLQLLAMSNNGLSGSLPSELANLDSLTAIGLANNFISSTLPPELAALASIGNISLEGNQLSGTIPESYQQLGATLQSLSLHANNLTGEMPKDLCPRDSNIINLRADCPFEVECDCCTECFVDPGAAPPTDTDGPGGQGGPGGPGGPGSP